MFKKYPFRTKVILSLFIIDQLSKLLAMLYVWKFYPSYVWLERINPYVTASSWSPIGITYTKSMGFSFGIFLYIPYNRALAITLFVLIIWAIQLFFRFYWVRFRRNKLIYSSFCFIIAGFSGNTADSIILGYARDIIAIPVLVATNLSDIFIVTGVFLLFLECITNRDFLKSLPAKRGVRGGEIIKAEFEKARPIVVIVQHDIRVLLKWLHIR